MKIPLNILSRRQDILPHHNQQLPKPERLGGVSSRGGLFFIVILALYNCVVAVQLKPEIADFWWENVFE